MRRTLWVLFAAFIVYGGTIPFHFLGDGGAVLQKLREVPLNPFLSPDTGRRLSIPDVVQNILLYLPFGALGFLAVRNGGRGAPNVGRGFSPGGHRNVGRAFRPGVRRLVLVTFLGMALSTFVESLQLLTSDRVSSLGDVAANTAGACLGAVAAWQLRESVARGLRRLRAEGLADVDELRPLAIAALVLVVAFWQPFDATLELGTIVGKVRSLQGDLWQFTGLRDEGTSIMLSAFLATTLASYLSVLGERRAGMKAAALGAGLVCLLEASQLFIGSRMPGLWDALVGCTGVAIGAALWSVASRIIWPRLWLGVLLALTLAAASLQMLSPFEIAPAYRTFGWFPFLGYYSHTTFETLSHVIELMLLYFPLGFWLARSRREPAGPLGPAGLLALALLLTLAIAAPIEYLQGWVVGRYPDVSDVGVSLFGAWLGVRGGSTKT